MANYSLTATARVPSRPLSIENKNAAVNKELIVDYVNHNIYIKDEKGNIVDITSNVIEKVIENIKENPTNITDITIELPSGESITISEAITQLITKIGNLEEILNDINLSADNIETTEDKQFVSQLEKDKWDSKHTIVNITASIKSGSSSWTSDNGNAPFKQIVDIPEIKFSDYPIIGLLLSNAYSTSLKQIDNYGYIYRILTFDGYIEVYSNKYTEIDLTIMIKLER